MPTTPYAKILVSVNAGPLTSGGLTVANGDTITLAAENSSGWRSQTWRIYGFYSSVEFPCPVGWTDEGNSIYSYSASASPPSFTLPAAPSFGKWLLDLEVNQRLLDGEVSDQLYDNTSALSIVGAGGTIDVAYLEDVQFDVRKYTQALRQDLRGLDAAIAGGVGGGVSLGAGLPTTLDAGAAAVGAAATASPLDHKHAINVGVPVSVGAANAEGVALELARRDHVHDHGAQTDPTQHAVATTTDAGFMSSADKTKLDGLSAVTVDEGTVRAALALSAGDVSVNNQKITNVAPPVAGTDATNKDYVDGAVLGAGVAKVLARGVATENHALVGAYAADGIVYADGDRILETAQAAGENNGIWVVNTGGGWARATDADASSEVSPGLLVAVAEGTRYASSVWALTTIGPITLGTTPLTFVQVGAHVVLDAATTYSIPQRDANGLIRADRAAVGALTSDAVATFEASSTTAAAAGVPQHSPPLIQTAKAWDTTSLVSRDASWATQARATDGDPVTIQFVWASKAEPAASYIDRMSLSDSGFLSVSGAVQAGYFAATATAAASGTLRGVADVSAVTVYGPTSGTDIDLIKLTSADVIEIGTADATSFLLTANGGGNLVFRINATQALDVNEAHARFTPGFVRSNTSTVAGAAPPSPGTYIGFAAGRGADGANYTDQAAIVWDEGNSVWRLAYDTAGLGTSLGPALPLLASYFGAPTGTISSSGLLRAPNLSVLAGARNFADTGDVVIAVGADDGLYLGETTYTALTQVAAKSGGWFAVNVNSAEVLRVAEVLTSFKYGGQGTTLTLTNGVSVVNSTPAADGAQQYSPPLMIEGRGWATGVAASQTVLWALQTQPVQGASPSGNLVFASSVNGAAATVQLKITSDGVVTITNATTVPSSTAASTADLYVDSGTTKIRSSNGVVTTLAPVGASGGTTKTLDKITGNVSTTDGSTVTLVAFTPDANTVTNVVLEVLMREAATGNVYVTMRQVGVKRGAGAPSTLSTDSGAPWLFSRVSGGGIATPMQDDDFSTTPAPTVTIVGNEVRFQVTGTVAKNLDWFGVATISSFG